jgi:hypothetical protein
MATTVRELDAEGFHLRVEVLEDHAQVRAAFKGRWLEGQRQKGDRPGECFQRCIMQNFPRDLCPLMPPNVWIKLTEVEEVPGGVQVSAVLVYWLPVARA